MADEPLWMNSIGPCVEAWHDKHPQGEPRFRPTICPTAYAPGSATPLLGRRDRETASCALEDKSQRLFSQGLPGSPCWSKKLMGHRQSYGRGESRPRSKPDARIWEMPENRGRGALTDDFRTWRVLPASTARESYSQRSCDASLPTGGASSSV